MKWRVLTVLAVLIFIFPARPDSQEARFTVNGDGTVTDNATGLMWQRCSAGLSGAGCATGTVWPENWEAALAYCEDLVLPDGGHSDWRLPDIKELRSIVDNTTYNPAIDRPAFPGTVSNWYWSSSTACFSNLAWSVDFYGGHAYASNKVYSCSVRCVR